MMGLQQAALAGNPTGTAGSLTPVALVDVSANIGSTGAAPTPAPVNSAPTIWQALLSSQLWNLAGSPGSPAPASAAGGAPAVGTSALLGSSSGATGAPIVLDPGVFFSSQTPSNPIQPLSPVTSPWGTGYLTMPWYTTLPPDIQQGMYFNNDTSYGTFVTYFYGVARSWAAEASAEGITNDSQLQAFFTQKLNEEFQATRGVLAAAYPGLTDTQYRLLMAMNLATGYYIYGTQNLFPTDFGTLLSLQVGNCAQIAQLTACFAILQGVPAQVYSYTTAFPTALGEYDMAHQWVVADGMWLDAEANVAFSIDPTSLQALPPYQRLSSLISSGNVYGFYNWYLNPPVRNEQLSRGFDGGVVAWLWYYNLASLGYPTTSYGTEPDWLPPLAGT
jgi:hypothetical protein